MSPGRVSDILLQEENIIGVEISDGLIKDILHGRGFLLYRDIKKWGKDTVLLKPGAILYRPQLSGRGRLTRTGYLLLLLLLIIPLTTLLRPLLFALLISYGIFPAVAFLRKKGASDSLSAFIAIVIFFAGISAVLAIILPLLNQELRAFSQFIPRAFEKFSLMLQNIPDFIQQWGFATSPQRWQALLDSWQEMLISQIAIGITSISENISVVFDWLLAPILAYYLLKDWEQIKQVILAVFSVNLQGDLAFTGKEIHKVVKAFLHGNIITSLIVGCLTFFCLYLIGLDFPGILGLLAGLGNFIPYFGAIISAIPVIIVSWLQAPWLAITATGIVILIQQFESNILTPKILSTSLGLSPIMIILALIVGGEYFGILGMFFAAPIAAILQILAKSLLTKLF
jgi:predicted PurR-regulated permease PerM